MCIKYRGNEYHYGVTVTLKRPDVKEDAEVINILMTKFMDDRPYVYSGLCLDNELYVTTNQSERRFALCDLIVKIKDGTKCLKETFAERYPSQPFKPYKNILEEEPEICEQFTLKMKHSWSFDEYKELRILLDPILEGMEDGMIITDFKPPKPAKSQKVRDFFASLKLPYKQLSAVLFQILYDCRDMVLAIGEIEKDSRFENCVINYARV